MPPPTFKFVAPPSWLWIQKYTLIYLRDSQWSYLFFCYTAQRQHLPHIMCHIRLKVKSISGFKHGVSNHFKSISGFKQGVNSYFSIYLKYQWTPMLGICDVSCRTNLQINFFLIVKSVILGRKCWPHDFQGKSVLLDFSVFFSSWSFGWNILTLSMYCSYHALRLVLCRCANINSSLVLRCL